MINDGVVWAVDMSDWQGNITDTQMDMLANMGMDGLIFKGGQNTFESQSAQKHSDNAERLAIPSIMYFWPDPIYALGPQVDRIRSLLNKFGPAALAFDHEQWWSNWSAYYAYARGSIAKHEVPKLGAARIEDFYNELADAVLPLLQQRQIESISYSAKWFDYEMNPGALGELIKRHGYYWHAQYFYWIDPNGDGYMSEQEFWDHMNRLEEYGRPTLPTGIDDWDIWQISSNLPLRGLPALDINIVKEDKFEEIFGGSPIVVPPDPPAEVDPLFLYRVTRVNSYLNVRSKISTEPVTDLGELYKYSEVPIVEERDGWGRAEFWVHLGYGTRREV